MPEGEEVLPIIAWSSHFALQQNPLRAHGIRTAQNFLGRFPRAGRGEVLRTGNRCTRALAKTPRAYQHYRPQYQPPQAPQHKGLPRGYNNSTSGRNISTTCTRTGRGGRNRTIDRGRRGRGVDSTLSLHQPTIVR